MSMNVLLSVSRDSAKFVVISVQMIFEGIS